MARKRQKKGVKGNAANYVTRNKALKTLQLSLKDFRRLCILKGIYPREPRKKVHGHNKTYYLTKDIQFLSHEHIISKFREMKTFRKKMKRAVNKDMDRAVASLERNKPRYQLDHIVRCVCSLPQAAAQPSAQPAAATRGAAQGSTRQRLAAC